MPYIIGSNHNIDTDTYLKEYYGLINKSGSVQLNESVIYKNDIVDTNSCVVLRSGDKLELKVEIMK